MKIISRNILKIFGWKLVGEFPEIKKSVVLLAPHTSNWDFIIGRLYLHAKGINNNTLMKKEAFFFPLSIILKFLGAIPVDRKNKKVNVVTQVSTQIKNSNEMNLFIAPEGTRKRASRWKKGFFYIAKESNVPIVLSFIDYKKKEVGIAANIIDSQEMNKSISEINSFYKNIGAKYPENFELEKIKDFFYTKN